MRRTRALTNQDGSHAGWLIECPGCNLGHLFDTRWTFNGNAERPSFAPSMLANAALAKARNADGSKKYPDALLCHSYVTNGRIEFLADCEHALRGQTVELSEYL